MISPSQRPLPDNTQHSQHKRPCPGWDSNPRSQQASGRRPTPQTARLLGPAISLLLKTQIVIAVWLEQAYVPVPLWLKGAMSKLLCS